MAETKSGSINLNTSYRYCSIHGENEGNGAYEPFFHPDGSIKAYLSYSVTRSDKSSNQLTWTFNYSGTIYGGYGYKMTITVSVGGKSHTYTFIDATSASNKTTKSGKFTLTTTNTGSTDTITVTAFCSAGDCTHRYSDGVTWTNGERSAVKYNVAVPAYQSWTNPTGATNVKTNISKVKPDGSLTVSWTAAKSGTGNTVKYYAVNYSINGGARTTYNSNVSINSTSLSINIANLGVKSGDKIVFDVDTWYSPTQSGGSGAWTGYSSSPAVSVYKDGCIYYKDGSTKRECTTIYYKDGSTKRSARYIKVKDSSGATYVVDVIK